MKHWTRKRWASLGIHTGIVLVPFSFSAASALLFWHGLFQSWLIAVPLVAVIDVLALLGLVLFIVRIDSPFQALRHLLPFVSIVPLGVELYAALEHNGVWVAAGVAGIVTVILVLIAWQCFRTIEALFIDPVTAAREQARAQLQALAISQAQLMEVRAISEAFVVEWQTAHTATSQPASLPHSEPQAAQLGATGDTLETLRATAAHMRAAGHSWSEVAGAVGRSVSTVRGWLAAPAETAQEA